MSIFRLLSPFFGSTVLVFIKLIHLVHPLDDHQKNECEGDQQNKQDLQGHQDEQSLQEIQDLQTEHGHQDNDSHDEDNVGMGVAIACTRPEGTQEMVFSGMNECMSMCVNTETNLEH